MTGEPGPPRVLVAGGTVTGLVLAALLERHGLRVTHIGHRSPADGSPAPLALDALSVLGDLGVTVPTTAFDHVAVEHGDRAALCFRDGTAPYADRAALRERLRGTVDSSPHDGVDRVDNHPDGVCVRFGDGERARFDLVAGADGPNSFLRTAAGVPMEAGGVHEWSFRVDRSGPSTPREAWAPGVLATATPLEGGLRVRLAVAGEQGHPETLAAAALSRLGGPLGGLLDGEPPDRARYQRLPDPAAAATWRAGRVAFCGGAAAPLPGLSGLSPALGVGDAAVLAAAVAEAGVPGALDRYAARRRRRLTAVRGAAGETRYPPTELEGPLGRVAGLRSVALVSPSLPGGPPTGSRRV